MTSSLPSRPHVRHWFLSFPSALCVALTIIALCVSSPSLQAQVIDWNNTTGSPDPWYDEGTNWIAGSAPTASQTARFNQAATYEVWWDSLTASNAPEAGFLNILQGDVTFEDVGGGVQHLFTINGSGGAGAFSDFSISGAGTSLTNSGMHLRSLGGGEILGGGTLTLDGSATRGARLTVGGTTGFDVSGSLIVEFTRSHEERRRNLGIVEHFQKTTNRWPEQFPVRH